MADERIVKIMVAWMEKHKDDIQAEDRLLNR